MIDATGSSLAGIQPWFALLLDLWMKSTGLCLAALLLFWLCGGRRPLARSAILHACLIGLTLLPLATLVLPRWTLGDWQARETSERKTAERGTRGSERGAEISVAPPARETSATFATEPQASAESPRAAIPTAAGVLDRDGLAETTSAAKPSLDWRAGIMALYAVVAACLLIRLSLSLAAVQRLRRAAAPLSDAEWRQRLAHWRQRLGVRRPVELLQSDRVSVPVVVGWRRPAVMAPARMAAAEPATIDAVLLHELAHVGRGDYGWNLLLRLLEVFYWPNPLIWLAARSLGQVREQACDELCIHWLGGAESYRATLVELAASLLGRPLTALGMAMARPSRLQRRMAHFDASRGRAECQSRLSWRMTAMIVVGAIAGAIGALRTASRAEAEPPTHPQIVDDNSKKRPDAETPTPAAPKDDGGEPSRSAPAQPTGPAAEGSKEQPNSPNEPAPETTKKEDESAAAPGESAPQPEPIKVRVEKVRREDLVVQTSQPGTLKAFRSMELYSRVAGLIVARQVDVGDVVKAGQVLAEIDSPDLDAELEQTKALAEEAPAVVEQAQGKLDETSARLEAAQALVAKSEAELATAMRNNEARFVAKAQLIAAKAEVKQAEAAVAVAKAGLRIAQLQSDAALARLKRVTQQATFRQIMAPADGIVMRQAAEPGAFAKLGGEPLFVISATNVVVMQTNVPESDALQVAPGQHARVWLDAERNAKPHDAKVSRVGYAIDPKTRTMPVEIALDNADGRLRPGMYGKATIDVETHQGALTTAYWAVVFDASGRSFICFRAIDGRAVKTEVVQGDSSSTRREIKSGLNEGDIVITQVVQLYNNAPLVLKDGDPVEIVNSDSNDAVKSDK